MTKNLALYKYQHRRITFLSHQKSQKGLTSGYFIVQNICGFSNLIGCKHFGLKFVIFSKMSQKYDIHGLFQHAEIFSINPKYYENFACTWYSQFWKYFEILWKIFYDACNKIIQNIQIMMLLIDQVQVQLCHRCPINIDSLRKTLTSMSVTDFGDRLRWQKINKLPCVAR